MEFHAGPLTSVGYIAAHPILVTAVAILLYGLSLGLYRLSIFHPLAEFPGPKLAGLTYWYEIYYDIYRPGDYTKVIIDLHKIYGPIMRINPDELHVSDPSFIEVLYTNSGKKRESPPWHTRPFQFEGAHFGTANHDLHRTRRAPLNRFFSKAMISKLEPAIKAKAIQYCKNLETWAGTGEPIDLVTSISCFSTDVITEYLYGDGNHFLDDPRMPLSLYHPIHMGAESILSFRHFPIYMHLFNAIPSSIMERLSPVSELWRLFRVDARIRIRKIKEDVNLNVPKSRTTVFHELLTSDLPDSEKGVERMGMEAQSLVGAGIETVTWCLSVAIFYLLSAPEVIEKLRAELETVIPATDPTATPPLSTLEQLPYLSACVNEALRLSYGVGSRLPRSSPDEPIIYKNADKTWMIPPGYAVGMSSYQIHHDETLFPDSRTFKPERWLDERGKRHRHLDQYLLSFSKGSRQCLGMNLAQAEVFTLLALLIHCYGHRLQLFETTIEDVEFHHDAFIPAVKPGSKGIRVLVK